MRSVAKIIKKYGASWAMLPKGNNEKSDFKMEVKRVLLQDKISWDIGSYFH